MEMQWNNEDRVHSEIIPFPSGGRFCFLSISCIMLLPLMYYWRSYAFNRLILSNEFCNKSTHIYMYIEKSKNPKIFYHTNAPYPRVRFRSYLPKGGSSGQIGEMYTISWHVDLINAYSSKIIF